MSTASNPIFTGSSAFSQDFQNVITRAVQIASLPITQLTNQQTTLANQSGEITTLTSRFSGLQSAVAEIGQALSNSCSAASSAPTVVTASAGSGAVQGDYSILVSDPGAYSTMMTGAWSGNASDPADTYQLWIGSSEYDVTPADNSAASVASAINTAYGGQVHATVVNVGSDLSPDYRVALESAALTTATLDLKDNGTSLAAVQNAGRPAQYEIDNSGQTVSSSSRTVNVATGVTLTILNSSTTPVDVSVTGSTSALARALSDFASAYNAAAAELTAQRGQSAGPLQGDALVQQLSGVLSGMATYTGSGLTGLGDLGLELGSDGNLTFDASTLNATASANPAGITAFLGSATGGGFLAAATNALDSVGDATSGLLGSAQSDLQTQITSLTNTIDDKQTQVDNLQTQLQNQMAAADAAIATMEQQYSYLSSVFQAMQTAAQQNK